VKEVLSLPIDNVDEAYDNFFKLVSDFKQSKVYDEEVIVILTNHLHANKDRFVLFSQSIKSLK